MDTNSEGQPGHIAPQRFPEISSPGKIQLGCSPSCLCSREFSSTEESVILENMAMGLLIALWFLSPPTASARQVPPAHIFRSSQLGSKMGGAALCPKASSH